MKTQRNSLSKRGFTLMELMVAMAITTIIVTVLVSITSIALDTWNRSRAELRAARQGKAMVDAMARDFESLVTRRSNTYEWLSAITPTAEMPGGNLKSSNACELTFFTAATDRYDGQIGSPTDNGGDVSCAAYSLSYKDPVKVGGTFQTFVLNRLLVNPDETFNKLLGKDDLASAFSAGGYTSRLSDTQNFVCENIYQFSLTFHVQVAKITGTAPNTTTTLVDVPVTVGKSSGGQISSEFRIKGSGIVASITGNAATPDELKAGRLTAVEIAVTVISDFGIDQMRKRPDLANNPTAFLAKNSYQYSKLIQLPSM